MYSNFKLQDCYISNKKNSNNNNSNVHCCEKLVHVHVCYTIQYLYADYMCHVKRSYVIIRAVSVPQQVDTVLTQLTHVAATQTRFTNAR